MTDIDKYYFFDSPIEPKVEKDWKKKYPEFCIGEMPGLACIEKEYLKPDINRIFEYVDDRYIMIDVSIPKNLDLGFGIVLLVLFLLGCLHIYTPLPEEFELLPLIVLSVPIGIPAFWFFIRAFFLPKERKIIFDRERGLVQVPGTLWGKSQLIRFKELHAVQAIRTRFQGGTGIVICKNKTFADKYLGGKIWLPFDKAMMLQSWSFWVWYMDKNRPLPYGSAFDPYRERDYERRKKEGFPEPLHPSYIDIPEYFSDEFRKMNEQNRRTKGRFGKSLDDYQKEEEMNGSLENQENSNYYSSGPN